MFVQCLRNVINPSIFTSLNVLLLKCSFSHQHNKSLLFFLSNEKYPPVVKIIWPAETCWSSAANENTCIRLTVEDIVENQLRFMKQFVIIKDCQSRADNAQWIFICHVRIVSALMQASLSCSHSQNCLPFVRPDNHFTLSSINDWETSLRHGAFWGKEISQPTVQRQITRIEVAISKCQYRMH